MRRTHKSFSSLPYKDLDAAIFAELVASEQHHRRLFELTNDLIVELDMNGMIQYVSPSVAPMLGYESDALIGESMFELVHLADRKKVSEAFKNIVNGKESERVVVRVRHSDGNYLWAEGVGQLSRNDKNEITGVFAIIRDITAQHDAMEQLRHANIELKAFRLAIQHAYNHIIICDADARILFANKGVERMTGYSVNEVIGKTPAVWGKQMPKAFYDEFWDTIKNKRQAFHGEVINKRKNGDLYRAVMTVSPILDGNETLVGFVGVEEDISHIKPPR